MKEGDGGERERDERELEGNEGTSDHKWGAEEEKALSDRGSVKRGEKRGKRRGDQTAIIREHRDELSFVCQLED